MLNSIWAENANLPAFPQLEGDLKTDVLIIGGGLAGLLCTYRLTQAGVDCALIEADKIFGGVSRNTTAKITSQHGLCYDKLMRRFGADAAYLYWQANEQALDAFRELVRGVDCAFETKDSFLYTVESPKPLEQELAALQKCGIPAQWTDRVKLPFSVTGAIRFLRQAQFDPIQFASHIAKGLKIFEHTRAQEFVGDTVTTAHGTIRTEKIIVATHFPMLNKHGSYFLKLYQQRSYVLALENAPQVEGMYLGAEENGLSFRNHKHLLLLGGGGHRTGKQGGGWEVLEQFAGNHYPRAKTVTKWATQDCMTLDGIPYIGQYSKQTPNLYVATGFNKWGMTSSMVAAMLLEDLVQGKNNIYESVFSPSRSMLHPQLLCNGAEAVLHLLTPTKPRCPHMGCALKWNAQERSWDCPCHGSRFNENGKLMDNPATGDLK